MLALGGGNSLIKVREVLTPRFLPRAVQQLKLLPKVDKTSHFYTLEKTRNLVSMALEQTNEKL